MKRLLPSIVYSIVYEILLSIALLLIMLGWMEIKVRSRNVEMVMLSQVVQGLRELPYVDNKIKTVSSKLETYSFTTKELASSPLS